MRQNLLTGQPLSTIEVEARKVVPLRKEPAVDPTTELLQRMQGTLEYLRLEPAERAKKEAEPLIELERNERAIVEQRALETTAAMEKSAREAAAALEIARTEHLNTTTGLRSLLGETQDVAAQLRADLARSSATTEEFRQQAEKTSNAHHQALVALAAAEEKAKAAARIPAPQVVPPLKSADITLDAIMATDGLLQRVVLKAKGYDDVAIDIERDGANSLKTLIVR